MALDLSTLTTEQQLAAIYIGYYDRAADPAGEDFWESAVANPNLSLADIATDFATQSETLIAYPFLSDPTAEQANAFISEVYLNLFNRAPDAAGLEFWGGALLAAIDGDDGALSVGEIILSIISGAQNTTEGQDLTTILNKIEVSTAWTDAADAAGIDYTTNTAAQSSAQSIIEGVTSSSATVAAAKQTIDNFFEPTGTPGEQILLTSATDVLTGTADDDEFLAYLQQNPFAGGVSNSLSSADRLDGGAGDDRLYAELTKEFLGASGENSQATDIQPRLNGIEEIDIEARDDTQVSANPDDTIIVDAKNIFDHDEIGSYYSDGDLIIENLTTLLTGGAARNTSEITITMDHTDNFNSDNDASDLTVYFDNDYLLSGETTTGQADFFLLDQDAELRLLRGQAAEGRLDEIGNNGIRFEINGQEVEVTFDGALLDEDAANEINDHDAFIAALQPSLVALIADGTLPAGTQIVRFDYSEVLFDDDGLALNRAALQDGSFSDLIPAIRVISGDGSPVAPLGFTVPDENTDPFNVFGRVTADFQELEEPISVDIELEKAGRGGEGGDLIIGGKAQNTSEGIAGGIEVFNISVKGIGGEGAMAKPSNVGTITSTLGALEVVNIVTDPMFAQGDSFASLVVRNGFDQDGNADIESGDLRLVDANGFLGNLTLGDVDANNNAGRITNLDTLTALGGGDVEFNAFLDGNEEDQAYTYQTGAGDDIVNVEVDGDALDFAGSSLNIVTGGGNDEVGVLFAFDAENNSNQQLNQAILDNVTIDTGDGNDEIDVDGVGNANILAGAGDDVIYTDGGVATAVWALNFDNIRADAQGLGNIAADNLPGVQTSLAYVGGATVTVTLSGATIAATPGFDGGVMSFGVGAVRGDDGYESRPVTVTVDGNNEYYGTQADVNRAVVEAINNDPVLQHLLEASISSNNTVVIESLTSGRFAPEDLRVEINQLDASSANYANAVLSEARSVFSDSDLSLNDLWGTTSFASPADYEATAPGANLTTSVAANAWYDGLSATGDAVNSAADNLHTAGSADTSENDNIIDGGAGDDVIVLSTDAFADGVTAFNPVSVNAGLTNGASNEVIVLTGTNFGDDTVMNFSTAGLTSTVNGGIDFLDFTAYLTSMENTSSAAGNDSDTLIDVTLATDLSGVRANEVAVVTFDNTDDTGETFSNLTASVIEQLFNNAGGFTGFDGDSNYGSLSTTTSNAFDEYTETANTDQLIGGNADAIVMVENADNDGEYKVFRLEWNGDASNDTNSASDGVVTAALLGSLDFGDSLTGLSEANLVGSAAFEALIAAGLNGGGITPPPPPPPGGGTTVNVNGTANAPTASDAAAETFVFADATYAATITDFDPANDSLDFPDTGTGNLSLSNAADDGQAQLTWTDGTNTIDVTIVGLTSAEDLSLTTLSGFDIV